jgi:hypothetical protein
MFLSDTILVHRSFLCCNRKRDKWYQKRNGQYLRLFSPKSTPQKRIRGHDNGPISRVIGPIEHIHRRRGIWLSVLTHRLIFLCRSVVVRAEVESERHTSHHALHRALRECMERPPVSFANTLHDMCFLTCLISIDRKLSLLMFVAAALYCAYGAPITNMLTATSTQRR